MRITLDLRSPESYDLFIRIKRLPKFAFVGRTAVFPDEYANLLDMKPVIAEDAAIASYSWMFDYAEAITTMAIRKRKFAVFVEPGYGKTNIMLKWCEHVARQIADGQAVLIVCPLMVVAQTVSEALKFFGWTPEVVKAADLNHWLHDTTAGKIGITNYDALTDDIQPGRLAALACDESSMLKSMYGKWGGHVIRLGKGLAWKLALTGTPAPNDRIEYANHAVFLDAFPNVNSFLAKYFINRGQTDNRWELKPHALDAFYRDMSHWSFFMANPATYGWKDNVGTIPPIIVKIHDVSLTLEQQEAIQFNTGALFAEPGGIVSRSTLSQISKGNLRGQKIATNKPEYIRNLVESFGDTSSIIWCNFNDEQAQMESMFPTAHSIQGSTPHGKRFGMIDDFKTGRNRILISKGEILQFGLNLQIAEQHVFSGVNDSYEEYYQCIKRSNRVGSINPLYVHIPATTVEQPMISNVLRKAARVQEDTNAQERLFKNAAQI